MIPQIVQYALTAGDDDNIATAQAVAGAGDLVLDGIAASGGVATLDTQRRVLISSSGNDTGINFTVYGTRLDKGPISETIAGGSGAGVYTTQDFYTVTRVAASAAAAGTVKVGTNGIGSSPWQSLSQHMNVFNVSLGVVLSGTVNYTVQYTYDDPNGPLQTWPPQPQVPTAWDHPILVTAAANAQGYLDETCWGWRVLINSGTGTVKATATQQGMHG